MSLQPKSKPLTRAQMIEILSRGESVGYRGNRISSVSELPSEADMATDSGDPAAVRQTADSLDAQIAALQSERAKLSPKTSPQGNQTPRQGNVDLNDLSAAELKERAKAEGVPNYGSLNKADLIAALTPKPE